MKTTSIWIIAAVFAVASCESEKEDQYKAEKELTDQSIALSNKRAKESMAETDRRVQFIIAVSDVQLNHSLYLIEKRSYARSAFYLSKETNAGDIAIKEMQLAEKKRSLDEQQEKLNEAISRLTKYAPDADTLKKMTDEMSEKQSSFQSVLDSSLLIMKHGGSEDIATADKALEAVTGTPLFIWWKSPR